MFADPVFFNPGDFAVAGLLAGRAVQGVLELPYAHGDAGLVGMASVQPGYVLPTAHVVGDPVGQTLAVAGATYLVAAHEPDGTGVSRLILERSA